MFRIDGRLFFVWFLLCSTSAWAGRISGGGGSGSVAGGGGGASSLEVFSNLDAIRSSPTASIKVGNGLKTSISGSTFTLNVDFSSVTSRSDAILNQNLLQAGAMFYVSSGTVQGNDAFYLQGTGGSLANSSLRVHFVPLPRSGGIGPQEQEAVFYALVNNDASNSVAASFALTASTVPIGTGTFDPPPGNGQSVRMLLDPMGGNNQDGDAAIYINRTAYFTVTRTSATIGPNLFLTNYNCSGNTNSGKLTVDSAGKVICADDISGGGGGGGTPIEAINNYDSSRSSPTLTFSFSNDFSGSVSGSTYAVNVKLQKLGSPQYYTLQDFLNAALSPGRVSGGSITDNGNATVNVSSGVGFIKAFDVDTSTNFFVTWPTSSTIPIPINSTRYLGVKYNSGVPVVSTKSADSWDLDTEFPLGVVVNESNKLYIATIPWVAADNNANIIERFESLALVSRDNRQGGLVVSNTGTRNVAVTAGQLLARMSEFPVSAIDTSVSGIFDHYYRNGSGGWTVQRSSTQWNNTQYDDGSGTLASITALSYSSRWWYLMTDGSLALIYGQNNNATLAAALNDGTPSAVPDRILKEGLLIGRFIIQASGATPSVTQSAFGTAFTAASVTNFSDLAGTADISAQTNLTASNGVALTGDALSVDSTVMVLQTTQTASAPHNITNGTTDPAMKITQTGNAGTSDGTGGAFVVEITSQTGNGIQVYTNRPNGTQLTGLLYLRSAATSYDEPMIYIKSNSTSTIGANADIRIDANNPDIEFVETDQTSPAGKFEIDVNNDRLRFNARNTANTSFQTFLQMNHTGALEFKELDDNGDFVALQASQTLAGSTTWVLPAADGTSNQAWVTNGAGNLSYLTVATAAAAPITFNGGTIGISPISLSTGVTGVLPAANMVSTVAFTNIANTFTPTQTFSNGINSSTGIFTGALQTNSTFTIVGTTVVINGATMYFNTPRPASNKIFQMDSSGNVTLVTDQTGSGAPGGVDTQFQYNNATAFGGVAAFTYSASTNAVTISSYTKFANVSYATYTSVQMGMDASTIAFVNGGTIRDKALSAGTSGQILVSLSNGLEYRNEVITLSTGSSSASGTAGMRVSSMTADTGYQLVNWNVVASQTNTASSQMTTTITYTDGTTVTNTTAAATAATQLANPGGIILTAAGAESAIAAGSVGKKVHTIAVITAGTGTGTRAAVISAQEIPQ